MLSREGKQEKRAKSEHRDQDHSPLKHGIGPAGRADHILSEKGISFYLGAPWQQTPFATDLDRNMRKSSGLMTLVWREKTGWLTRAK